MPQKALHIGMEEARTWARAGMQAVESIEIRTDGQLSHRQSHGDVQRAEVRRKCLQQGLQQAFIGEDHGGSGAVLGTGLLQQLGGAPCLGNIVRSAHGLQVKISFGQVVPDGNDARSEGADRLAQMLSSLLFLPIEIVVVRIPGQTGRPRALEVSQHGFLCGCQRVKTGEPDGIPLVLHFTCAGCRCTFDQSRGAGHLFQ